MSVSRCQQALYIGCIYILETCMYTFIPCGQDSRCRIMIRVVYVCGLTPVKFVFRLQLQKISPA